MDKGGRNSRGLAISFHVSENGSRDGMGRGNGYPVAAVYATPRPTCTPTQPGNQRLGPSSPRGARVGSGTCKRKEAYYFTACNCLLPLGAG